ncbi:uncharacterized protein OCT59_021528 [Rhizophagus irregularis]|uniref:Uncharacterized protein n=1 Tax=Rhizophagus irregularis (strain DAOM 181602 / DAOM 197198 / MUCL 43194) TaxID=747089 RepID=U9SVX2_RHIID|nr:hypothetical protein GLOIN_2v1569293 [Rhizophagus irregularis DAOM 181602=DAOM 197198]POG75177.1 hypothetical protein GLOIN_2v1569293 [Rhizophagus irregularis DAOM 181602=DAOM 197198]UZO27982.1 hypothetical protein OCT59_021528 [Rhizophagus irregularis]GET56925.1 hypothetical protein GLOIN_2v1569293 [Rhizophagus irregularis DAOM 181602=DAOM 197198]|eukprot:XP_025182043.1 hypothetical protein GLOIN_2v1569293 [Rhizophagus irregularis DAOM 181602=DAOM 197198]
MSSTKRPYNETISSNSSISTTLNDTNDYIVLGEQQEVEQEMDIEEQIQQVEEENFVSRRKRANTDKDDLFKSNTNDHPFQSSTPISSTKDTLNYPSSNTFSNTPDSIANSRKTVSFTTTTFLNNYISPKDSFNNNMHDNNSTLKVSEDTKALSPIDLLMSSPPISTSTPKTSQTKNTSNSSLTLTTQNSDTWDFNYTDSSCNTASNSNDNKINSHFPSDANIIHTNLNIDSSHGPFSPIYSQIYDSEGIVFATESFNYLVQLYEFCDNNSTNLQSKITSILGDLVLLINNQLDGFDIPFIEHHKWNGSHFYGSVDVEYLLDQLDDGLGISSAKYVWYDYNNNMRISGSVLQCGCRRTHRTHRRTCRIDENQSSSSSSASSPTLSTSFTSDLQRPANNTNDLQDNDLRHAVLNRDAEREAQIFLELLAEEEENGEDNDIEQEEESDSFTEISKESDDDDDFLIQGLASTSIRQRTDTFGNPIINQTRTTSARHISRPSADNDGNDTDDSLDDYLAESGNLTESTYEEIDFSDVESTATDSTIEDGWHNVSRDN